ncbi:acyltransferase [Aureimonas sp. AU12]|uniref:acyltransferase family protein n=1 Tax=Aureimonas sp. AU12 TaxID=1638161 RepID=UPI0007844EE5|nr:acyltransferase [Aureimonas sp. AU12]
MIANLQTLRGIAAFLVVLFHVTDSAGRLGADAVLPAFPAGAGGVDLFFVISGFIIWTTTRGIRAPTPGGFLLRRLVRVVPLYWLLTLLLANVAILRPDLLGATVIELRHFLASLVFLPWPHPTFGLYNPFLVVGWTLNYEMAFYGLFALVLLLPERRHLGAAIVALVALVVTGRLVRPEGIAGFYSDPIVLEFALGLAVGGFYTAGARIGAGASAAAALCGAALLLLGPLLGPPEARVLTAGLPAAMLVAGAVFFERARGPLRIPGLARLGDASYSLYLTHLLTLPLVQIVWRKTMPAAAGASAFGFVAAAVIACIGVAILCHRLAERPLAALLRPRRARVSQRAGVAA